MLTFGPVPHPVPGDWFAVPLTETDYVLGRIARFVAPAVLGYFFDGRQTLEELERWLQTEPPTAGSARTQKVFSHLAFTTERWPVAPNTADFRLTDWPLPEFAREGFAAGGPCYFAVRYSDDDLITVVAERHIDESVARSMPGAGHAGAGYVRDWLTRLTSPTNTPPGPTGGPPR